MAAAEQVIVVGGSWGGLAALGTLLAPLPVTLAAPIAAVLHRGALLAGEDDGLARALGRGTPLPVREAEDKQRMEIGHVYLAPSDYHLLVEDCGVLAVSVDAAVHHARPSIDVLFESAAAAYGSGVLAVLLTGASSDGTDGLRAVHAHGGVCLVQDPATAERPEMPRSAIAAGVADVVGDVPELSQELTARCGVHVGAGR